MSIIHNYDLIDLAKIIASILVLCIHLHPLEDITLIGAYILDNGIARLAVPFFFTASSFFFFKKINLLDNRMKRVKIIKKYYLRIIILYVVWSIIYFPFNCINWIYNDISFTKDLILYGREVLILGTYGHLWYFPALIFSISIVYILQQKLGKKGLVIFACITYLLGILYNFYPYLNHQTDGLIKKLYLIYEFIFTTSRNGLFFGVIFVALGYFLSKNKEIILKRNYVILIVISLILLIIESLLVNVITGHGSDMYIMLVPTTYFLFRLLLAYQIKINKLSPKFLRNISTIIYTSQYLFIPVLDNLKIIFNINSLINFVLILTFVVFIGISIIRYSERQKFKILRYLY